MSSFSATFRSMGTDISLSATGIRESEFLAGVEWTVNAATSWERCYSRFDPASELSRLNATSGATQTVSVEMFAMLEWALAGYRTTGGLFDPGILLGLENLGYDRDFQDIRMERTGVDVHQLAPRPASCFGAIQLDRRDQRVRIPAGMRLDLGGIAKGAFADRVAAEFTAWPGGCIDAGGDLVTWGVPPDGDTWRIGVERPDQPGSHIAVVIPFTGEPLAVATSGRNRRTWSSSTGQQHHLIDPLTSQPVQTPWLSVTAIHYSATAAEIAAKAALIASGRQQQWISEETVLVFAADNNELEVFRGSRAPLVEILTTETLRATA